MRQESGAILTLFMHLRMLLSKRKMQCQDKIELIPEHMTGKLVNES